VRKVRIATVRYHGSLGSLESLAADPSAARVLLGVIGCALLGGILSCYGAVPDAEFEVVSIKPVAKTSEREARFADLQAEYGRVGAVPNRGRTVRIENVTLVQLIAKAHSVRPRQVIFPQGAGSARFDIEALLPEGASARQAPEMLKEHAPEQVFSSRRIWKPVTCPDSCSWYGRVARISRRLIPLRRAAAAT